MYKGKRLLEYKSLFSPYKYKKHDKIMKKVIFINSFEKVKLREIYCIKCKKYKEFKKPKILYICYKSLLLSSICN